MLQIVASLTDNSRCIIYDCHIVVWCLIKGNKSHGTINPTKEETTQDISLHLIDILFVLFTKFSGVLSNGHFTTDTVSEPHLHSISYYLNLYLSPSLLPIPHSVLPVSISYKKEMIWTIGIIE